MQVKVWNGNVHPFTQEINGTIYSVPANGFIEIDEDEADKLVKRFSPVKLDGNDVPLPESYKMLKIDEKDIAKNRQAREQKTRSGTYVCQACGYVAANKWELNGHAQDMHEDEFEDQIEAMSAINSEKKKTKRKKA